MLFRSTATTEIYARKDTLSLHDALPIWLSTYASNERALRSYRAVGFVEEGRQREHGWAGGQYQDQVLMALFRD